MKFGRVFHEFRIPEFEDAYLDYNYYKRRFKTEIAARQPPTRNANPWNELLSEFVSDLDKVQKIYSCKLGELYCGIGMSSQYGGFKTEQEILDADIQTLELENVQMLYAQFRELLNSTNKLIWYGYVHKTAVEKLYKRLSPSGDNYMRVYYTSINSVLDLLNQDECLEIYGQVARVMKILSSYAAPGRSHTNITGWVPASSSKGLKEKLGPYALGYAAKHGRVDACRYIIESPSSPPTQEQPKASVDIVWTSPLKHGVIQGNSQIVELILGWSKKSGDSPRPCLNNLLLLAARSKFDDVVSLLISHGADVNFSGSDGETALYIAARSGRKDSVESLLRKYWQTLNVNVRERSRHWTPLFAACIYEHVEVAQLLMLHGADRHVRDVYGWTLKDHAAFRGNFPMMQLLSGLEDGVASPPTETMNSQINETASPFPVTSNLMGFSHPLGGRCITGCYSERLSRIYLVMGSSNLRSPSPFVDLNREKFAKTPGAPIECRFAVKITTLQATGPTPIIPLPVLDDRLNHPLVFTAEDPNTVKFMFDVIGLHSYSDTSGIAIASAVGAMDSMTTKVAEGREHLVRDHHIPLVNTKKEYMGSITFHTLVVKPYNGTSSRCSIPPPTAGFWKPNGPMQVVGHRGSGANSSDRGNLQLGENTLQSFETAISLGASCVEFDVQLTRDFKTVIFHDFLVKEIGGDIPTHSLTRKQFMLLGTSQSPRGFPSGMAETRYLERSRAESSQHVRPRSLSLNDYEESRVEDLHNRMKETIEGSGEITGNIRGSAIQEPFTTLEDLLTTLPESVPFDIELKHPMLWETEDRGLDPIAIDVNLFVDTILSKVYELGGARNISFSSFSPEVCIMLAHKQDDFPVLFISKAGKIPAGDVRASSMQHAIQFAKRWSLAGVVMLADPLVESPRLIRYAKRFKLVCASYGNVNDDPKNAKIQANAGLDAIIVNKVRLIAEALKTSE